jgi:hypothetical protein
MMRTLGNLFRSLQQPGDFVGNMELIFGTRPDNDAVMLDRINADPERPLVHLPQPLNNSFGLAPWNPVHFQNWSVRDYDFGSISFVRIRSDCRSHAALRGTIQAQQERDCSRANHSIALCWTAKTVSIRHLQF